MFSEFVDGDVGADVHAAFNFDAEFAQYVDFSLDDVLFEFIGRNTVSEHSAGTRVLFKHGGLVSFRRKIVCTGKSSRSRADDCDFFGPLLIDVRRNDDFGNESRFRVQVLFRDELLDVVDCDGFVDGAPCAGGFATLIADASADCGERIVLFDKFQRFPVLAFFGFSYVALNRDVSGTCNLTRRRTRFVAVDAVVVAVIFVPLVGSPAEIVGEFVLRIFDFALFRAKFLSEFYRSGGAVFHALAARHAFVFFNPCDVRASGHIRRVEKLRRTQSVADIDIAVADCENLVFAVDIRDLMYETVLFGVFQNLHCLVVSDIAAFARFAAVIRHIADTDAPFFTAVAATFAQFRPAVTARTNAYAKVTFVLFEPIRNMLDIHCAVFHLDCFLDGDNVHTDSRASRGNHRRDHCQGKIRHTLEEHREFRMIVKLLLYHVREFRRTGNEHR